MITKLCSEDFNAYTEDVNPKPEGTATNLRSAGQVKKARKYSNIQLNKSKTVNELYNDIGGRYSITLLMLIIYMTTFQEDVLNLIDKGYAVSEIGKILEKPYSSVSSVLKRFSVKPKKILTENTVRHDYFDIIDSSEKAYFLGFFIADGYLSKTTPRSNGRMGILISEEDSYILEEMQNCINCPRSNLRRFHYTKGAENRKPQASLR